MAYSCCGARALGARASVVAAHGLSSCGTQASVVVAHGLSCSVACGIFPDQGSNPRALALAGRFLTAAPPGKSQKKRFIKSYLCFKKEIARIEKDWNRQNVNI